MPGPQLICVYQFKVVLHGISPIIWRRLLLRRDQTIADLHYAIQIAMGWSDSHLHRFHIHGKDYGVAHEGGVTFDDDPEKIYLADFGFRLRERFLYRYDFYDEWEHDVRLDKVLAWNNRWLYPVCTGGNRLAPPEDCGGAGVYMENGDRRRWSAWWDAMPRQDLALLSETLQRVLDGSDEQPIIDNRREQQLLRLIYVEGMTPFEIGNRRILDIGSRRVNEIYHLALEKLRAGIKRAA